MMGKNKYPLAEAFAVASQLVKILGPGCERIEVAGSIRRRKSEVSDVEIVYVPILEPLYDLFGDKAGSADKSVERIDGMIRAGILQKRKNVNGSEIWGQRNRLARHVESGIPVDLFATTDSAWWNYLVCRTGGRETNERIARCARARGWKWNPYGDGFTDLDSAGNEMKCSRFGVSSERDVFEFVGLEFAEPEERA